MIHLILFLIVIGVGLYIINELISMDGKIKQIINIVVVLFVLYYLVDYFHLFHLYGMR